MYPCIFLVGLHGSGKTTLGRLLQSQHGWLHISMGNLGRLARSMRIPCEHSIRFMTALSKQAPGQALTVEVVAQLLSEIERLRQSRPVSVDGFPSDPSHASLIPEKSTVMHIMVDELERETRLIRRAEETVRQWNPGQLSLRDQMLPSVLGALPQVKHVHNMAEPSAVASELHRLAFGATQS